MLAPQVYVDEPERTDPVTVLIVPGHDSDIPGAVFRGMKEADLNVELSEKLYALLDEDPAFAPVLLRNKEGYLDPFVSYFEFEDEEILEFLERSKKAMTEAVESGEITAKSGINHNRAPREAALRLHGVNKWANEYDVDLILHVHFNDYVRKVAGAAGEYSGFSMYIPEKQFGNSEASRKVAESIFDALSLSINPSSLPLEKDGIIESQTLIAIGSNNSLEQPSLLVEYGYIYEPQLQKPAVRDPYLSELAWRTYAGIRNSFAGGEGAEALADSALYPRTFAKTLKRGMQHDPEVLSLQSILIAEDVYYKTVAEKKSRCTLDGMFGPCTDQALRALQKKHGIRGETGYVGTKTRAFLNAYGVPAEKEEELQEASTFLQGA